MKLSRLAAVTLTPHPPSPNGRPSDVESVPDDARADMCRTAFRPGLHVRYLTVRMSDRNARCDDGLAIGVIGLGAISSYYLDALRHISGAHVVAVCDSDMTKLSSFDPSAITTTTDHRELVQVPQLDAAIVSTPNNRHADMCSTALEAGLDVCCEKPLTLTSADACALRDTAGRAGGMLFTAFHRRYNQHVRRLACQLSRYVDAHGPVSACRVRYLERIEDHCGGERWYLDPGTSGGGCLSDNGPNAFDVVRLLLGDCEVAASALERPDGLDVPARVEQEAGGVPALVELDWAYPGERKDVTVELADGTRVGADMLCGFAGFKASLAHEYELVVDDFVCRARHASGGNEADAEATVGLVEEAYRRADEVDRIAIHAG